MTHYIVTEGSYSDYHICFVSSNKEVAERYCKLFNCDDVEEWPDETEVPRRLIYEAAVASDGEVEVRKLSSYAVRSDKDQYDLTKDYQEYEEMPKNESWVTYRRKLTGRTWIKALGETEEEAKKIACDAMAQIKARKAGI